MTDMDTKWAEALEKLTARQDEQAETLRGIETTLTSRLDKLPDASPLSNTWGDFIKALVGKDDGKAEAARNAYTTLLSRDYTGSVTANFRRSPHGSRARSASSSEAQDRHIAHPRGAAG